MAYGKTAKGVMTGTRKMLAGVKNKMAGGVLKRAAKAGAGMGARAASATAKAGRKYNPAGRRKA